MVVSGWRTPVPYPIPCGGTVAGEVQMRLQAVPRGVIVPRVNSALTTLPDAKGNRRMEKARFGMPFLVDRLRSAQSRAVSAPNKWPSTPRGERVMNEWPAVGRARAIAFWSSVGGTGERWLQFRRFADYEILFPNTVSTKCFLLKSRHSKVKEVKNGAQRCCYCSRYSARAGF
jgi:hypothetical protein